MGAITRGFANKVLGNGAIDATGLSGNIPASNVNNTSVTNITSLPASFEVIESTASDPSPAATGTVWYNSTSAVMKFQSVTTAGTWAAGGNLNTARNSLGGSGTQTAGLGFGGYGPGFGPSGNMTESYNGTSWTTLPATLGTGRYQISGFGTQTAAVAAGGNLPPSTGSTEKWNGTSWTASGSLNTPGFAAGTFGTHTAGLLAARDVFPSSPRAGTQTEAYNGTSWTSLNPVNTGRQSVGASNGAPQTAGLIFGGNPMSPPNTTSATESWNGTNWTTVSSLNTARRQLMGGGTQTEALAVGGQTPVTGATELWNGSSWTTNPNSMGTARYLGNRGGSNLQTAGIVFGGSPGVAQVAATEEFTGPGVAVSKTVTVS